MAALLRRIGQTRPLPASQPGFSPDYQSGAGRQAGFVGPSAVLIRFGTFLKKIRRSLPATPGSYRPKSSSAAHGCAVAGQSQAGDHDQLLPGGHFAGGAVPEQESKPHGRFLFYPGKPRRTAAQRFRSARGGQGSSALRRSRRQTSRTR